MRILGRQVFAGRKTTLIFLLAIFLPTLVIGYLGFDTFAKRRESVKGLLESNLWVSARAALQSIEQELFRYERQALSEEIFSPTIEPPAPSPSPPGLALLSPEIMGRHFILDDNFRIIVPRTEATKQLLTAAPIKASDPEFNAAFQRAEYFEFSKGDRTQAAEEYRKILGASTPGEVRAPALEGLGRSLYSSRKYKEARAAYSELLNSCGQLRNKAGHPYAALAALQLYGVEQRLRNEENGLRTLLGVYGQMRNGAWIFDSAAFDFFSAEMEAILDSKLTRDAFPEMWTDYQALKAEPSSYREELRFKDFLQKEGVPQLLERNALLNEKRRMEPGRFLDSSGENIHLISYILHPQPETGKYLYGGFLWNLDWLKDQIFPRLLEAAAKATGLDVRIMDAEEGIPISGDGNAARANSLSLDFRDFPLPWKLIVAQPAFAELEKSARRENIFYGALIIFVMVLMLFGAALIVRDISRESETTRLKTEFVHNVSHELKTPLTLIRLFGETLLRKKDLSRKDKQDACLIITKESERLSHMIDNILDFSRIEMGRREFDFKPGDLSAVVEDTLEAYRYHLEKKGFSIRKDITSGLPEMVFDREALAGVLVNLLGNAVKFSVEKKEVAVNLFRDDGQAVLQVADKGIGISRTDKIKIFERFYRARHGAGLENKGSGLGLALVKHVIEAHNGRIEVESEPGKGSVFSVFLPFSAISEVGKT